MKTHPIKSDSRWTISREYTGHASGKPQFVIRFCGEWVNSSSFYASAVALAVGACAVRNGALTVENIPA